MNSQLMGRFCKNPFVKANLKKNSDFLLKKSFLFVMLVVLLAAGGNISRAVSVCWYNDAGNNSWTDLNNWRLYTDSINFIHQVPGLPLDDAVIMQPGFSSKSGPVFNANDGTQTPFFIVVGCSWYDYQYQIWRRYSGVMTMSGGTLKAPWGFTFNKGSYPIQSTMYMSGGLLYLGPWPGYDGPSDGFLGIGRAGTATFNMTGGTIECVSFEIPESGTATTGIFNLDGGVVSASSSTDPLSIGVVGTGRLNITKGRLILNGNQVSKVSGYVSGGKIIAYPSQTGRRIINVDYDSYTPGQTTVTASKTALAQAYNPVPMDTHPNVEQSATLYWTPGDGAISHNLYLGIDVNDVNDATEPLITTDVTNFTPNSLVRGQTYYWRVDEYNGSTTSEGQIWSFTVAFNPKASAPSPANGATNVDPNADLGWTAGDSATAHDVYFGTSFADVNSANNPNVPPGRGRRTDISYEPGTLEFGRQYYWRIDEFDGSSIYKGDTWSFEVVSNIATYPQPGDGKRFVGRDVILRWSAGYRAISHDIYLGTNFTDVNNASVPLATVLSPDYSPAGLESGTTYYWRIDEHDGGTTHKGHVWQFTTEPVGLLRAFPGADGYGAYSLGGRNGDVYHVTNLTDDATSPQPGSLRYGINTATGPRTIVFDVSGYIELQRRLEITKSYITIAGQTAPGLGITLRKHDVRVYNAHDVIIRYIRERMGYYTSGQVAGPGGMDALSVEGASNVIIDHVSTSWSRDELMSATGDSNDITVQWCMLTEPLNVDEHSKASLLRPAMTSRLTHHHNLYADIMRRVTRFGNYNDDVTTRFDWYNNVVFNWGSECTFSGNDRQWWDYVNRKNSSIEGDEEFVEINFLDNYFIVGPSTSSPNPYHGNNANNHKIWASGIFTDFDLDQNHDGIYAGWDAIGGNYMKMSGAFSIESPYTFEDAPTAYEKVLARAGASFVRDGVDERIVSQVETCTGSIPNTQDNVGGWPAIAEVHRPADFDTDGDGMPNAYEIARGLNPNDPADGNIAGDDGYTNLEKYLNYLVLWRGTLKGDFNIDDRINFVDLSVFIDEWLLYDPTFIPAADLNGDGYVNWYDFALLAKNWNR